MQQSSLLHERDSRDCGRLRLGESEHCKVVWKSRAKLTSPRLALKTLGLEKHLDSDTIKQALQVVPPCRLESIPLEKISLHNQNKKLRAVHLDVGHNPAALVTLILFVPLNPNRTEL